MNLNVAQKLELTEKLKQGVSVEETEVNDSSLDDQ